jgi:hypothetical protein
MLFRFHWSIEYGSLGWVSYVGAALERDKKGRKGTSVRTSRHIRCETKSAPSMNSPVNICTVLNFDRLRLTLDQPPELLLDIVLRDVEPSELLRHAVWDRRGETADGRLGRMIGEPVVSEGAVSLLEAVEGMILALQTERKSDELRLKPAKRLEGTYLVEPKLGTRPEKTRRAEPGLVLRHSR